jgi:hypothetical protein
MEITIVVQPLHRVDEDDAHRAGLTERAAERLGDALQKAGFELVNGPTRNDVWVEEN